MHRNSLWFALFMLLMAVSWSIAKNDNNDPKAQLSSALAILNEQLSSAAKAKIGGDLKFEIGNINQITLDPQRYSANFVTNINHVLLRKKMKDQMDKYGIKVKIASPEVKAKLLRALNELPPHAPPAYMMLFNNKIYISGLLVFKNDVKAIGTDVRKKELQRLKDIGVLINNSIVTGNEYSVEIPADKFIAVLDMDSVKKFSASRVAFPDLDLSIPDVGADTVWNRTVSPSTGAGVVVGVVDTGVDLTHPDFQIAPNNTRIQFLWDQTSTNGPPPAGYTYGTECTKTQIDAGNCPQMADCLGGHGTHTIGISAGNGSASSGTYKGIAYQSDIYYVKTSYAYQAIVDGIFYIQNKAAELGKPAAISVSVGSNFGPHDGFAIMDYLIDQKYNDNTAGLSLAFSAANYGTDSLHADGLVCPRPANPGWYEASQTFATGIPFYSPDYGYQNSPDLILEYYYPANKNINARFAMPVMYDSTAPYCNNQLASNWAGIVLSPWVPEFDQISTTDAKPNVWGATYQVQRYMGTGSGYQVCDTLIGDVLGRNQKWAAATIIRESDCTLKNNGHGNVTRCNTAMTTGGCDYHLDNELASGTDAIFVRFRPAAPADVWDRTATISGCGSSDPHETCANDLFHCMPCTDSGCYSIANGPGWGYGWGTPPNETACPNGTPGYGFPAWIYVLFDEKNPGTDDPYGDGGCYNACGASINNCTGIAEVPDQQTQLDGFIPGPPYGTFQATGFPEDCTMYNMEGDNEVCISDPASSYSGIAAAAYVTRQESCNNPNDPVGSRPAWSSAGPMRAGTPAASWYKPELSAPGESIASANPLCLAAPACPVGSSPYSYQLMSGTSMSAPHISGAAALLFQCCPSMTLGQVRNLLDNNALDAGTAGWDALWGWGKLRVNAAYLDLLPVFAGIQSAVSAGPTQINLAWDPATADKCPTGASYDIFRIQGTCPFTPSLTNRIAAGAILPGYNDAGLTPNTQYSYIVRAVEGNACSEDNMVCMSATTPSGGNEFPGRIENTLQISKSGTSNLQFQWSPPGGNCNSSLYELYRGALPIFPIGYTHQAWQCTLNTTNYTGPAEAGSYYYLVVAGTAAEEGSYGMTSAAHERPIGSPQCPGVLQNLNPC